MAKRNKSEIYSIFGQIEGVVADAMVAEGKVSKIQAADTPASALYDDRGRKAHCALVMNRQQSAEFDRRVAALYA